MRRRKTKSPGNAGDRAVFPKSWMAPAAAHGKKLVYVSDIYFNAVEIYPAGKTDPAPIGSITEGISRPRRAFRRHQRRPVRR